MTTLMIDNQNLFLAIVLAMISGLSIRVMLSLVKQRWVSTYHHTMSYILLPLITLIVTKVISGNIALSLGMIGALSIVRFRNPVKNPFELVMFFALITIGISMAIKINFGILLAGTINIVILISYLLEILGKRIGFHTYALSFDEGNSHNILEIEASRNIPYLDNNKFLLQYVSDKSSNTVHYRLASRHKDDLDEIRLAAENDDDVSNIELRFS
jgi:hypothetical protein|tara:strand:- start:313 stop:954 length:642 start_codon:yes stop_codon:yes gene_type:complete